MTSTTLPVPYPENSATGNGDGGQKQVSRRPQTIHCEACDGAGVIWTKLPGHVWSDLEVCDLCLGTGREPIPNHEGERHGD